MVTFLFTLSLWLLLMSPFVVFEVILLLFLIRIGKHSTSYFTLTLYRVIIFTVIFLISMFRVEPVIMPVGAIDRLFDHLESISHLKYLSIVLLFLPIASLSVIIHLRELKNLKADRLRRDGLVHFVIIIQSATISSFAIYLGQTIVHS